MIRISGIKKSFGGYTALEDFTFSIEEGHICGIVGYNGAGKTTLLKILAGIYRPERGEITVGGAPVYENESLKRQFFMVQDDPLFFPQATLRSMAAFYKGFYPGWSDRVFRRLAGVFGLDPSARINGFSRGMQRQASILLGLSTLPRYLLLDESFDGLDLAKRNLLKAMLFAYLKVRAANILISSHNLRELEGICDHIGMIRDKRLFFGEAVEEMRRRRIKFRAVFAGEPPKEALAAAGAHSIGGTGRSCTFLSGRSFDEVKQALEPFGCTALETLPMTLEEIFLGEQEVTDYDFSEIFS